MEQQGIVLAGTPGLTVCILDSCTGKDQTGKGGRKSLAHSSAVMQALGLTHQDAWKGCAGGSSNPPRALPLRVGLGALQQLEPGAVEGSLPVSGAEPGSLQRPLLPKPLCDSINKAKRQICQDAVTLHMEVQEIWQKVCLILSSLELFGSLTKVQQAEAAALLEGYMS